MVIMSGINYYTTPPQSQIIWSLPAGVGTDLLILLKATKTPKTSASAKGTLSQVNSSEHNHKAFDQEVVEAFASLFKGRTDAHGQVNQCVYEPAKGDY